VADLRSSYLGLELRNPVIASAGPLSQSIEDIKALADAGLGAVTMFSLFEEQTARPVGQDVEAGVYVVALDGDVIDVVDRFVGGGVGVEVFSELYTNAFAIFNELAIFREVF